jgi:hypothetical protein
MPLTSLPGGTPPQAPTTPAPEPRAMPPSWPRPGADRRRWALVPALAGAAYGSVLGLGFAADDFVQLNGVREPANFGRELLPIVGRVFYRPVGWFLTWWIGWNTWGANPWPYHLISLALHAAVALVLGLWLAQATGRPRLGWLAGALFAALPLHLEAVGWISAQFDEWAALFGVLSLYCFTAWLSRPAAWRYALALVCYSLGLFTKESLLAFLPLLALAAWLAGPRRDRRAWARLGLALLPFAAVLAVNVSLRLAVWGRLGSYPAARTDYPAFFWDALLSDIRILLAPLNPSLLGLAPVQIVGAATGLALLVGLARFGAREGRLLVVAGAWIALAFVPALNLPANAADLQGNRFFYLPAAGYCLAVAALLDALLSTARRPAPARAAIGLLLLGAGAVTWAQLAPWQTATAQVSALERQLRALIPPEPRANGMVWYAEKPPETYQGAYVAGGWLDAMRGFTDNDMPYLQEGIVKVPAASAAPIAAAARDAFALRFRFDAAAARYVVDAAAGVTDEAAPPGPAQQGSAFMLWDFRACPPAGPAPWQALQAQARCVPAAGLTLQAPAGDAQLALPRARVEPAAANARFVRLRVALSAAVSAGPRTGQWFWRGAPTGYQWDAAHSRSFALRADGAPHVYWTFLAAGEAGAITGLRLDPAPGPVAATVAWIAVDLVP